MTRPGKRGRLTGRVVAATHNAGKLREIEELLGPFGVVPVSAGALGLAEPEETGSTFSDNALLKARAAARASGMVALADDSGLCVEALNGAPGIYSARWAGPTKDFGAAMARVERSSGLARPRRPGARISSAYWRSHGRTARLRLSRVGWTGRSSFHRGGRPDLATIRSFALTGTNAPSAR